MTEQQIQEMSMVRIGWTGFCEVEGGYDPNYEYHFLNWITDEDSAYVSKVNGNKGNPLTDTTKWTCIASGKAATAAAKRCLELISTLSNIKDAAVKATERASQAANGADQAAELAEGASGRAAQAADLANKAVSKASAELAEMEAVIASAASGLPMAPTRMTVSVLGSISTKNKVRQRIGVQLYPEYLNPNVTYQRVSGDSALADPSGLLTLTGTGETVFWVIPTLNTGLWQRVAVSVRVPHMRLSAAGKIRLVGGKIRIV